MRNQLYPIFLKVTALNTLIVGGGNVALEKLTFLLKSSPDAKVQMVKLQSLLVHNYHSLPINDNDETNFIWF